MINLIGLELKRNKIRTYIFTALWITIGILGFLYLFAATPYMEANDADMAVFMNYTDIMVSTAIINMAAFCVLSTVMYTRFVIEEYKGTRAILLFSYPVSRKKVFLSKFIFVSAFTAIGLIVSNLIVFTVFLGVESVFPLVGDKISADLIVQLLLLTLISAILAAAIGAISMSIGFRKKSAPTTIVSSVVMISVLSSVLSNMGTTTVIVAVAIGVILVAAIAVTANLIRKITWMEA